MGISPFTPLSFRRGAGGEAVGVSVLTPPLHYLSSVSDHWFGEGGEALVQIHCGDSAARCRSGAGGTCAICENERDCEVSDEAGFFVVG